MNLNITEFQASIHIKSVHLEVVRALNRGFLGLFSPDLSLRSPVGDWKQFKPSHCPDARFMPTTLMISPDGCDCLNDGESSNDGKSRLAHTRP